MEALTPGPWRAGTQFRELRDLGGRKTEVLSEVAELEPNRRFVIRSKTGPEWLGIWLFEPEGQGTRLRWTGQMRMKGFGRLLEPPIGRQMRAQIERQFAQLPGIMEQDIPASETARRGEMRWLSHARGEACHKGALERMCLRARIVCVRYRPAQSTYGTLKRPTGDRLRK
jgi:hypothetical protein